MNILNILPYSPFPAYFGGALRIYHLLRHMVRSHTVTAVLYGDPRDADLLRREFGTGLREVRVIPPPPMVTGKQKRLSQAASLLRQRSATSLTYFTERMQAEIEALLHGTHFDIIQIENYPLGHFRFPDSNARMILDAQNVEHDSVRRMADATRSPVRKFFYAWEYRKVYREEALIYGRQDALLLTSRRDKELLDAELPGVSKYVVPNGVDTAFFAPDVAEEDSRSLVFTGSMNYYPNVDGMLYFLEEIFPIILRSSPDTRLFIVGNNPPKQVTRYAGRNVTITGFVPDVRPYVRNAAVYVVPLRMGGGTRLKVLEALAMKKAVVTTTIGCEGIDVVHGESLMVADEPKEFAAAVLEMMHDPALRNRLAENGHHIVRHAYDWSVIGDRLAEVYRDVMARPARSARHALEGGRQW